MGIWIRVGSPGAAAHVGHRSVESPVPLSAVLTDLPDLIDSADLGAWLAPIREAEQAGHVFVCAGGFIVSATR
jgi:hypothetical protein